MKQLISDLRCNQVEELIQIVRSTFPYKDGECVNILLLEEGTVFSMLLDTHRSLLEGGTHGAT